MKKMATRGLLVPVNRLVPLFAIRPHEENYNIHSSYQLSQLATSYSTLGQFRSVVLWEREAGTFTLLAGHGIVEAMRNRGATEVRADVYPPELDPLVAKQIMLADNLHAKNSEPDEDLLLKLLREQQEAGVNLALLGTDDDAIQQLADALLADAPDEPMPEPGDAPISEISEQWALLITCRDEEHQLELLERFQEEGLPCRVLIS